MIFKKIIAVGVVASALSINALAFEDVSPNEWYYDYLQVLTEKNIINGYEDNTFQPQKNITKGEVLKIIITSLGETKTNTTNTSHWAYGYLEKAQQLGIENTGTTTYELSEPASRMYVAQIIMNALDMGTFNVQPLFYDADHEVLDTLFFLGIVKGEVGGNELFFYPEEQISRAEISALTVRMLDVLEADSLLNKKTVTHPTPTLQEQPTTPQQFEQYLLYMVVNNISEMEIEYPTIGFDELVEVHEANKNLDTAFYNAFDVYHEYFTFANQMSSTVSGYDTNSKITITLGTSDFTTEQTTQMKNDFFSDAESILHVLRVTNQINDSMTDVEKAKVFFEFIVKNKEYDEELKPISFLAYGITETNEGVCQGYVSLLNTLLKLEGINAVGVSGIASGGNHIWTKATLDGVEYYLDPTFADPIPDTPGYVDMKYFLIPEEELRITHSF